MALVGDNGAGKSTLIKCIAGIYSIDDGETCFDGERVSINGPKDAAKLGIEVVYQDLALCDNLDVVQNMYLGREEHDFLVRLREAAMEAADGRDLQGPLGDDDPLDPPAGREPLGRPAPVRRDRPRGDVELARRDPRRADGGARRRADAARCSSSSRGCRAGARRRAHLAQPPRHLRGRRPDHRAAPRPQRRRLRAAVRRRSRRSSTRSPPACRRRSPASTTDAPHRDGSRDVAGDRRRSAEQRARRDRPAPLGGAQGGRRRHAARHPRPRSGSSRSSTRRTRTS